MGFEGLVGGFLQSNVMSVEYSLKRLEEEKGLRWSKDGPDQFRCAAHDIASRHPRRFLAGSLLVLCVDVQFATRLLGFTIRTS